MSLVSGVITNNLEEVRKSLKRNKKSLKVISKKYQKTPLELAVVNDNVEIVKYMLDFSKEKKFNYYMKSNYTKTTLKPLMDLTRSVEMSDLLLEYGFELEGEFSSYLDAKLSNPLLKDRFELFKWGTNHGADVNKIINDWPPIYTTILSHNIPDQEKDHYIKLLVDNGADIYYEWKETNIILLLLSYSWDKELVKIVLKYFDTLDYRTIEMLYSTDKELLKGYKNISNIVNILVDNNMMDALPQDVTEIFVF